MSEPPKMSEPLKMSELPEMSEPPKMSEPPMFNRSISLGSNSDELHEKLSNILHRFEETRLAIKDNVRMLQAISDTTLEIEPASNSKLTDQTFNVTSDSAHFNPSIYRRSNSIPAILDGSIVGPHSGLRTMSSVDSGVMLTLTSNSEVGTQQRWLSVESWKDEFRSSIYQTVSSEDGASQVHRPMNQSFAYISTDSELYDEEYHPDNHRQQITADLHPVPSTAQKPDLLATRFEADAHRSLTCRLSKSDTALNEIISSEEFNRRGGQFYEDDRFEEQEVQMDFPQEEEQVKGHESPKSCFLTPSTPPEPANFHIRKDVQAWVNNSGSMIDYIIKSPVDNLTCVVLSPSALKLKKEPSNHIQDVNQDPVEDRHGEISSFDEPKTNPSEQVKDAPEPVKHRRPSDLPVKPRTQPTPLPFNIYRSSLDQSAAEPEQGATPHSLSRTTSNVDCRKMFSPIPEESPADSTSSPKTPGSSRRRLPSFRKSNSSSIRSKSRNKSLIPDIDQSNSILTKDSEIVIEAQGETSPHSRPTENLSTPQAEMNFLASSTNSTTGSSMASKSLSSGCSYCKAMQGGGMVMPQDKLDHRKLMRRSSDDTTSTEDSMIYRHGSVTSTSSSDTMTSYENSLPKLTPLQAYRAKQKAGSDSTIPPVLRRIGQSELKMDRMTNQTADNNQLELVDKQERPRLFLKKSFGAQANKRRSSKMGSHEASDSLLRYFRFPSPPVEGPDISELSPRVSVSEQTELAHQLVLPPHPHHTDDQSDSSRGRSSTSSSSCSYRESQSVRTRPRMGTLTLNYNSLTTSQSQSEPPTSINQLHSGDSVIRPSALVPPAIIIHRPNTEGNSKKAGCCPFRRLFRLDKKSQPREVKESQSVSHISVEDPRLMLDLKHGEVKVHRTFTDQSPFPKQTISQSSTPTMHQAPLRVDTTYGETTTPSGSKVKQRVLIGRDQMKKAQSIEQLYRTEPKLAPSRSGSSPASYATHRTISETVTEQHRQPYILPSSYAHPIRPYPSGYSSSPLYVDRFGQVVMYGSHRPIVSRYHVYPERTGYYEPERRVVYVDSPNYYHSRPSHTPSPLAYPPPPVQLWNQPSHPRTHRHYKLQHIL